MSVGNPQFTILKAARLVDGNGGPVAEQAAILLEGDSDPADRNERNGRSAGRGAGSRDRLR